MTGEGVSFPAFLSRAAHDVRRGAIMGEESILTVVMFVNEWPRFRPSDTAFKTLPAG